MALCIEFSKIFQYCNGDIILFAHSSAATCPVATLHCYFSMAETDLCSQEHVDLFRGIVHPGEGEQQRTTGSLSYILMRKLFQKKIL